jgi:hypothetical protein
LACHRIYSLSSFNPRSPHGERPAVIAVGSAHGAVSIHAPHTGSDMAVIVLQACGKFQSTLPTRGATFGSCYLYRGYPVSIHAPHTGSDAIQILSSRCDRQYLLFQSTLPTRGATPSDSSSRWHYQLTFQSTLPTRGATATSGVLMINTPRYWFCLFQSFQLLA